MGNSLARFQSRQRESRRERGADGNPAAGRGGGGHSSAQRDPQPPSSPVPTLRETPSSLSEEQPPSPISHVADLRERTEGDALSEQRRRARQLIGETFRGNRATHISRSNIRPINTFAGASDVPFRDERSEATESSPFLSPPAASIPTPPTHFPHTASMFPAPSSAAAGHTNPSSTHEASPTPSEVPVTSPSLSRRIIVQGSISPAPPMASEPSASTSALPEMPSTSGHRPSEPDASTGSTSERPPPPGPGSNVTEQAMIIARLLSAAAAATAASLLPGAITLNGQPIEGFATMQQSPVALVAESGSDWSQRTQEQGQTEQESASDTSRAGPTRRHSVSSTRGLEQPTRHVRSLSVDGSTMASSAGNSSVGNGRRPPDFQTLIQDAMRSAFHEGLSPTAAQDAQQEAAHARSRLPGSPLPRPPTPFMVELPPSSVPAEGTFERFIRDLRTDAYHIVRESLSGERGAGGSADMEGSGAVALSDDHPTPTPPRHERTTMSLPDATQGTSADAHPSEVPLNAGAAPTPPNHLPPHGPRHPVNLLRFFSFPVHRMEDGHLVQEPSTQPSTPSLGRSSGQSEQGNDPTRDDVPLPPMGDVDSSSDGESQGSSSQSSANTTRRPNLFVPILLVGVRSVDHGNPDPPGANVFGPLSSDVDEDGDVVMEEPDQRPPGRPSFIVWISVSSRFLLHSCLQIIERPP
jgi:hypothetical protein